MQRTTSSPPRAPSRPKKAATSPRRRRESTRISVTTRKKQHVSLLSSSRLFRRIQPGLTHVLLLAAPSRCKGRHVPGRRSVPTVSNGAAARQTEPAPNLRSLSPYFFIQSQIQLRAEDLYDKDKVDLETIVVDDVFKLLQCTDAGLDTAEAQRRLELFGPNKLESEEQNAFLQVRPLFPTAF